MASDIRSIGGVSIHLMDAVCGRLAGGNFIFIAGLTHQKCIRRSSCVLMTLITPCLDTFARALSWVKAAHGQRIHVGATHGCSPRTEESPKQRDWPISQSCPVTYKMASWLWELPADISRHHGNTSGWGRRLPQTFCWVKTESLPIRRLWAPKPVGTCLHQPRSHLND